MTSASATGPWPRPSWGGNVSMIERLIGTMRTWFSRRMREARPEPATTQPKKTPAATG